MVTILSRKEYDINILINYQRYALIVMRKIE